jgi:hypothetical protein
MAQEHASAEEAASLRAELAAAQAFAAAESQVQLGAASAEAEEERNQSKQQFQLAMEQSRQDLETANDVRPLCTPAPVKFGRPDLRPDRAWVRGVQAVLRIQANAESSMAQLEELTVGQHAYLLVPPSSLAV